MAKKAKKGARRRGLSPSALAREQGTALPERQALSMLMPGGPELAALPADDVGVIGIPEREPYHTLPVEPVEEEVQG
jgi:hypothetical protein